MQNRPGWLAVVEVPKFMISSCNKPQFIPSSSFENQSSNLCYEEEESCCQYTEADDPTGYPVSGLQGRGQVGHNCSVCGEGGEAGEAGGGRND